MRYLIFDCSGGADGVVTLDAMAATRAARHAAVLAEAQQVLDWAWQHFPHGHGPVEDGMDWHHDLQVSTEDGGWQVVTLTFAASPRFADALLAAFGPRDG